MEDKAKTGAIKHDNTKVGLHLLDPTAMIRIAEVMDFGAKKYAEHNWRKGFQYSRLFSATMRHLWAWWRGEDKDPETGLSHLAHAGCCVMFLIWHEEFKKNLDDRYKDTPTEPAVSYVVDGTKTMTHQQYMDYLNGLPPQKISVTTTVNPPPAPEFVEMSGTGTLKFK